MVALPGTVFKIEFAYFNLPPKDTELNECNDYLSVRDGGRLFSEEIIRMCGSEPERSHVSTTDNKVVISFKSDSVQDKPDNGFKLKITALEKSKTEAKYVAGKLIFGRLTDFASMLHFYTPWKPQKTSVCLIFSGGYRIGTLM